MNQQSPPGGPPPASPQGPTPSDYFSWYGEEITRYRNLEWKLTGYSIGLSYATVLFSRSPTGVEIVPNQIFLAYLVGAFVLALLGAEFHVHQRLNQYRAMRKALEDGVATHRAATGRFFESLRDALFFLGFVGFPTFMGALAVLALMG